MTTSDRNGPDISTRVRRIEAFFFLFAVPFIAFMTTSLFKAHNHSDAMKDSTLRELHDAITSLQDIQEAVSSLRETQDDMLLKMEKGLTPNTIVSATEDDGKATIQKPIKSPKSNNLPPPIYAPEHFLYEMSFNHNVKSKTIVKKDNRRKLEDAQSMATIDAQSDENANPDCLNFIMKIELDQYASETMWILTDEASQITIANITYTDVDALLTYNHTFCLERSQYSLTIFDQFGDGIPCESFFAGEPCYSYSIDGVERKGDMFGGFAVRHEFDTTRACIFDPMLVIRLYFDASDVTDWTLLNVGTGNTIHDFIETTDPTIHFNSTETAYLCMEAGVYRLAIEGVDQDGNHTSCENSCYDIAIEDNPIISGPSVLDGATIAFYANSEWVARERTCDDRPILAPINDVSSFAFDDRVSKILNVLQALSSLEDIFAIEKSQYRATCFILYDDANFMGAEDPFLPQRYVLALFLYATNQVPELKLPMEPCTSVKFTCNDLGEITGINWSKEGLGGTIPTEVGHLGKLESLILNEKELKSTIPSEITRLTNLQRLEMRDNDLTGTIPSKFGLLDRLDTLDLFQNKIAGPIPSELGNIRRLESLVLGSNECTGSIPAEIFNPFFISSVDLSKNKLTGTIPSEIGQRDLIFLFYSVNNFHTGTIPSEIGNLRSLFLFDVGNNMLTGTIPTEMTNLNWWINDIHLVNNELTGPLPPLSPQGLLYVSQNKLSGVIPEEIWDLNITGLKLEDNKLEGAVSESFCANLSFVEGFEEDGIYDLTVDDSPWYIDRPLVTCPCCDDVNCHLWKNDDVIIVGGTRKPSCPAMNSFKTPVFELYILQDLIADVYSGEGIGIGKEKMLDLCLPPTGCYEMRVDEVDGKNDFALSFDKTFRFGYSASERGLVEHDECDSVNVCGTMIAADDPKRMGLNHLTHIVFSDLSYLDNPSLPESKALCWIMTKDEMFHEFDICDGTLLQRYVMALFYYNMQDSIGFDELPSTHTCDWQGVTCNEAKKFVEEVKLPNKGLSGTLITELGLLTRLRKLNLGRNELTGTIDISIFEYLPHLEVFNLGQNKIGGRIAKEMLILPSLREFNVSNNLLVGVLPQNARYAETFESFDVENNLLTGIIPLNLIESPDLVEINLSRNNFGGVIPPSLGFLSKLKVLKLNQNSLSGSIPAFIFGARNIETLQLQANFLTGSIPIAVGNLKKAVFIALNHNSLKGPIPRVFEDLSELEFLHLHTNILTGPAPFLPRMFELGETERYMTDCGSPSYALATPITCETCTTCCNSDEMCQTNRIWPLPILGVAFIVLVSVPIAVGLLLFLFRRCLPDSRDPCDMIDEDSTYSLFFSNSKLALLVHLFTYLVQGCFYYLFLLASSFTHSSSDWQFTIRCPPSNVNCNDESNVTNFGWFLFYLITLPTLGVDFANSFFQIQKAASQYDLWLYSSGFFHLAMTVLAIFASVYYNLALATSNNELILNAVILLFINDLDEQFMNVLQVLFPDWVDERIEEVRTNMSLRSKAEESEEKVVYTETLEKPTRIVISGDMDD